MAQGGMSIKDLAEKLEITYEHARRIVRGEGLPSKSLSRILAKALSISENELLMLVTAEKVRLKFGPGALPTSVCVPRSPDLQELERLWGHLNSQRRHDLLTMARVWAKEGSAGNEP